MPFLSPAVTGTGLEGAGGRNKKGWTHWPSSTCFELAALEAGELSALGIGRPGRMKSLLGFSTEELLWKMGLSDLEPLRQTFDFGDLGGPGRGSETSGGGSHYWWLPIAVESLPNPWEAAKRPPEDQALPLRHTAIG